jgi:predicted negative regulator of RcsB-dependent stress response
VAKVARPKKKHKQPESAAATLNEIESLGDRLAEWTGENRVLVLGVIGAILVVAAGWGFFSSSREQAAEQASADLAQVEREYRVAMGASPGDIDIAEPANPETARNARTEFVTRFREVADEHAGSASATVALLQLGVLQQELGAPGDALETWRGAADGLAGDDQMKALLLERIASVQEDQGDFAEAGQSYEAAAEVPGYPLSHAALADAARCYAEAGDAARAVAIFDRLESIEPPVRIPDQTRARLLELRAFQTL